MTRIVEIDTTDLAVTPVFKWMDVENIPKSETAGRAVMEMREMCEIRLAGNKNYSPCVPVDAMWRREGNRVITYAERWPEQYAQFKSGEDQVARGTPLEMLRDYGITAEQLSLCRALKIYSIEQLHQLEGPAVKSLGMNSNKLKESARAFMADRSRGADQIGEIEALKAKIAELEARSTVVPEKEMTAAEIDAVVADADAAFADKSDDELKEEIAKLAGSKPRGTPTRATLIQMLGDLKAAA